MCQWEALNRPNFLKLRAIFEDKDDALETNMDNKEYVDNIIERVMKESTVQLDDVDFLDEDDDDSDEDFGDDDPIQFTQKLD